MADPPPFPFTDLHFNRALTSLVPEVGVGNDVWPPDVDYILQVVQILVLRATSICI